MASTDLERAVAVLALAYRAFPPEQAQALLSGPSADDDSHVAASLASMVGESSLLGVVAAELNMGFVDLHAPTAEWSVDENVAAQLGVSNLKEYRALPVRHTSGSLGVALVNPRAQGDVVDWVKGLLGRDTPILLAPQSQIDGQLVQLDAGGFADVAPGEVDIEPEIAAPTAAEENPVVEFLDNLLARAVTERASDLHFLSNADGSLLVRFRIDGRLVRQAVPLRRREKEIIGSLLAKCGDNIDATDRTRPQDGTFSFIAPGGRRIDARLGMMPQAHGPTIVVRILDPENINRRLEDMGFSTATLAQMRRVVRSPQGAVLFIGPTGSGKTTTLYSLLRELPALEQSILTAEDPIEYRLPNIGQTQIRSDLGAKSLTFSKALRSMLRLDPDVILIGEIRDPETAETAMQAAMTGHMVFSTLHAKTAVAAYQRLGELNVDPYLSAESLSLAVNQRLVRTLHDCAVRGPVTTADVAVLERFNLPIPDEVAHPRPDGCAGCKGTGFRGRVAVVEIMEPTLRLRELISVRGPRSEITEAAISEGYTSIREDAYRHVLSGRIPVMELLSVAGAGEY